MTKRQSLRQHFVSTLVASVEYRHARAKCIQLHRRDPRHSRPHVTHLPLSFSLSLYINHHPIRCTDGIAHSATFSSPLPDTIFNIPARIGLHASGGISQRISCSPGRSAPCASPFRCVALGHRRRKLTVECGGRCVRESADSNSGEKYTGARAAIKRLVKYFLIKRKSIADAFPGGYTCIIMPLHARGVWCRSVRVLFFWWRWVCVWYRLQRGCCRNIVVCAARASCLRCATYFLFLIFHRDPRVYTVDEILLICQIFLIPSSLFFTL